jgi:hypothetical protein
MQLTRRQEAGYPESLNAIWVPEAWHFNCAYIAVISPWGMMRQPFMAVFSHKEEANAGHIAECARVERVESL